jgi:hypothetical protein
VQRLTEEQRRLYRASRPDAKEYQRLQLHRVATRAQWLAADDRQGTRRAIFERLSRANSTINRLRRMAQLTSGREGHDRRAGGSASGDEAKTHLFKAGQHKGVQQGMPPQPDQNNVSLGNGTLKQL